MTVVFAVLMIACGRDLNPVGSSTAGELTVYTHFPDHQTTTNLAAFHAKYPNIKIKVVTDTSHGLAQRMLKEQNNPKADVIWGMLASDLIRLEWHNLLSPYAPAGLERVWPSFRDTHSPPYWVGISAWMSAFCVNTAQLKEAALPPPRSWNDLADPIYKDRLAMPDPSRTHTGYVTVATLLQLYGETQGWRYLDRLHQNIAAYVPSRRQSCRLARTGNVSIGILFDRSGVPQNVRSSPMEIIFPVEGSGWIMEASALVKKVRIKPVAKTFLDWAISDHAMQAYGQHHVLTTVPTRAPLPQGFPREPTAHLLDRDVPWSVAKQDTIVREWQRRYGDKVGKK